MGTQGGISGFSDAEAKREGGDTFEAGGEGGNDVMAGMESGE